MRSPSPGSALRDRLDEVAPKAFRSGTDRTCTPEQTVARAWELADVAGITRLADITGLDRLGLPVFAAIRPASRNLAVSQGKGLTPAAAQASALMESLELWHAETHHLPTRTAAAADLRAAGEPALDATELVRCPCNEYADDRPMRWVSGYDLCAGEPVWVPYEAVHCDWRLPSVIGEHAVQNGSNGLASGNTLPEAVVHALCELLERDAVVAFNDRSDNGPRRVRLDTVDDPDCRDLLARFAGAGIEMAVWDLTTGFGLPTFSCLALETDAPWYHPLPQTQGAGAHPRREVALLRAITEAAQSRATVIAGARDDIGWDRYRYYFDVAERERVAAMLAAPAERDYGVVPHAEHDTFAADLTWLLDRLGGAGIRRAVVVDLTIAGIDLPVVKVVVPRLRWRPWEE
jgi:ribosomal protein S12 methylthiotransferase accessory factor